MADQKLSDLTAITTPADTDLLYLVHDPAGTPVDRKIAVSDLRGASGSADHAYYTYRAALLEPLAIETLKTGTFSYAIGSAETKLIVNAWSTRLGAAGKWEVRDPREPTPLRGATLTGLISTATAVVIDPSRPTYTDARGTYLDRLAALAETATKYLSISTASTSAMFLPGPYGNIITSVNAFDATWLIAIPYGSFGWNLTDEVGDAAAQAQRVAHPVLIPLAKGVISKLSLGTQSSQVGADAEGSITYVICPASWGAVADPNTYTFRDDFLAVSLDTATKWTRAQSTVGNVEINTDFAWCKVRGSGSWGGNGGYSQASIARAAGKVFLCDVFPAAASANLIVGWHDGGGTGFTNLAHGLDFANPNVITILENGTSRGNVGSGFTAGCIYRVRLTLAGAAGCTYEIQGGPEYPPIGGASWTNITPGTTSSVTATLRAGFAVNDANDNYIGDVRVY